MKRWTDLKLRALKPSAQRRKLSLGRGLYFVVEPSGLKSWRYRYKVAGREAVVTLGGYPAIGLAAAEEARNRLSAEAQAARGGLGPAPAERAKVERAERLAEPTIEALAEEWLRRKGRAEKTRVERRRSLEHDVFPHIGALRVSHVKRLHIKAVIDRVVDRGALAQATYTHKVLRAMFRHAVGQGYLEMSPMQDMPAPAPYQPKDRALSETELRALFLALEESDVSLSARLCLEWQLLTAARPSEARLARWGEIEDNTWTIPASRSKNGKPHAVHISKALAEVLEQARTLRRPGKQAPLFPGREPKQPLSTLTVTRALARLHSAIQSKLRDLTRNDEAELASFTLHDLRRTAASLVTSLGFSRFTAGLLLNHTDRSVTAIYDRNTYEPEKRKAWEALGERVSVLKLARGNVFAIRRK